MTGVCRFFIRGYCRNGENCRYLHEKPREINPESEELTCGICLEMALEGVNNIGLLVECDHLFCMDCLIKWRSQSKKNDFDRQMDHVAKTCPLCRKKSNFIVPCSVPLQGEEKKNFIENYKKAKENICCKYFANGLGVCRFGHNCFYSHKNVHGIDQKPLQKKEYEELEALKDILLGSTRRNLLNDDLMSLAVLLGAVDLEFEVVSDEEDEEDYYEEEEAEVVYT